eukprot:682027-Amphidinium_carterae.1
MDADQISQALQELAHRSARLEEALTQTRVSSDQRCAFWEAKAIRSKPSHKMRRNRFPMFLSIFFFGDAALTSTPH